MDVSDVCNMVKDWGTNIQQESWMETLSSALIIDVPALPAASDHFEMPHKYVSLHLRFSAAKKYLNAKDLFTRGGCFHLLERLKSCFFQPQSRSKH